MPLINFPKQQQSITIRPTHKPLIVLLARRETRCNTLETSDYVDGGANKLALQTCYLLTTTFYEEEDAIMLRNN
jgi:F0F1-type ATP synthase epsilon subunit